MRKKKHADVHAAGDTSAVAHGVAQLVEALGEPRMGDAILAFLRTQSLFDSALVLTYRASQRPQVLADALAHPMRSNDIESYLAGAYLLDPMRTHALTLRKAKVVRMNELVNEDFRASEYFRTYYAASHLSDEVNFLIPCSAEQIIAICLERSQSLPPFTNTEIAQLRCWLPMFSALLHRHVISAEAATQIPADSEHDRLQARLATFGTELLTRREHEVVQHLLGGASAPDIARRLNVSLQTVRVHRRNIYEKLGVSSLGQLFSLAMRAVLDKYT
jgi:DNA-binding CsgD family transcriptional regulator